MATAKRISGTAMGQSTRESLTRLSDSEWEGQCWYVVDTDDPTEAMLASGLPVHGSSWSPSIPGLIVAKIGPPAIIVGNADDPNRSGSMFVPVFYRTAGSGMIQPEVGDAWTEEASGEATVLIKSGLKWDGTDWVPDTTGPAINDGEGMYKSVGVVELRVTCIYTEADFLAKRPTLEQYAAEHAWNYGDFSVPPVRFGTTRWTYASGRAQYKGFEMQALGPDKVQVVHRISVNGENQEKWFSYDVEGKPIGAMKSAFPWPDRPFEDL